MKKDRIQMPWETAEITPRSLSQGTYIQVKKRNSLYDSPNLETKTDWAGEAISTTLGLAGVATIGALVLSAYSFFHPYEFSNRIVQENKVERTIESHAKGEGLSKNEYKEFYNQMIRDHAGMPRKGTFEPRIGPNGILYAGNEYQFIDANNNGRVDFD